MPVISKNNDYTTMAAGAFAGAGTAQLVSGIKNHKFAENLTKALEGTANNGDEFMKKHSDFINKVSKAKKGYFGKFNKIIKKTNCSVSDAVNSLVDGYTQKATQKASSKFFGEAIQEKIGEIEHTLVKKDILKSVKSANRAKTALLTAGATLVGVVGAFVTKEFINNKAKNKN